MSTDHMAAASSDFDIFNLFDTDGGLKDLELKNKKITHYCQEDMVLIKCRGYKVHVVKVLMKPCSQNLSR
jgi:hypothetical protein